MKKSIKFAALLIAATISVAVVSCQKDKEIENENKTLVKSSNDDAKELLNRIYAFQSLRDDINSGAKSGESMTLEELRDNIDLTFNFEHSQHATPFDYATLDTFYVKMPDVDANGNVTAAEAIATYNAFESELENLMANVDDDSDLAKNFSIKFPEAGAKSGDDIEVVFTRGTEGTSYPWFAPFEEGDDYIWGYKLGRCDQGLSSITDAANELTKKIHNNSPAAVYGACYSPYKIEYVKFTPYQDNDNLSDYIYIEQDNYPYSFVHWLLCISGNLEDEPCEYHYELNQEYNNFFATHMNPNGQYHFHPQNGLPYYDCLINFMHIPVSLSFPSSTEKRIHTAYVTYAYAVEVTEE